MTNWEAVSAITQIIGIFLAILTILISVLSITNTIREQERVNRPYMAIEKAGLEDPLNNSNHNRIKIKFVNIGKRPAYNEEGKISLINKSLNDKPFQDIIFSTGNEIPPSSPQTFWIDELKVFPTKEIVFIVVGLTYKDAITQETFHQFFYLRWNGLTEVGYYSDFTHASVEEKMKLEKLLKRFYGSLS